MIRQEKNDFKFMLVKSDLFLPVVAPAAAVVVAAAAPVVVASITVPLAHFSSSKEVAVVRLKTQAQSFP